MDGRVQLDGATLGALAVALLVVVAAAFLVGALWARGRSGHDDAAGTRTGRTWPASEVSGRAPLAPPLALVQPSDVRPGVYRTGAALPLPRDRSVPALLLDVPTTRLVALHHAKHRAGDQ